MGTCTYQYNRNPTKMKHRTLERRRNPTMVPQKAYNEQHCTQKTHKLSFLLLNRVSKCVSLRKQSNPNNILIVLCTGLYHPDGTHARTFAAQKMYYTHHYFSVCVCNTLSLLRVFSAFSIISNHQPQPLLPSYSYLYSRSNYFKILIPTFHQQFSNRINQFA